MAEEKMTEELLDKYMDSHECDDRMWKLRNGQVIKVEDMETGHIASCIRSLNKKKDSDFKAKWIKIFKDEMAERKKCT